MTEFVRQHPKYDHNNHISEFNMRSFMVQANTLDMVIDFFEMSELYTLISDFECYHTYGSF